MPKVSARVASGYLYLDAVSSRDLSLAFIEGGKVSRKQSVPSSTRTERLLPSVVRFLQGRVPSGIVLVQGAGSFTQSRLVVATANALVYAWGIHVAVVGQGTTAAGVARKLSRLRFHKVAAPSYRGVRQ